MKNMRLAGAVLVAAAALLGSNAAASAQTIGFKVGPTWSKVHESGGSDDGDSYLQKIGGGGFVRFGMSGLSVQAEALAMTKGVKTVDGSDEASLKLDYIEVPVLLRFGAGTLATASPYVMVGPSFGFKTSCKFEVKGSVNASADCENNGTGFDLKTKSVDVGATGVVGLQFSAGPGALFVEGRYTHGLTKINDDMSGDKAMNRTFAAMAGYSISLK
jgi:hypothetical protein